MGLSNDFPLLLAVELTVMANNPSAFARLLELSFSGARLLDGRLNLKILEKR